MKGRILFFMAVVVISVVVCSIYFTHHTSKKGARLLRMGYLQSDLHQLAAFIALEKGLFKQQGLSVQVAGVFKAGPEEMSAFASGGIDFGYVGEAPATVAVANGLARVRVVAQVNKEGSSLIVRSDSHIHSLRDLIGKVVAIPGYGTVQDFLLRKALRDYQMRDADLKIIILKPPEMPSALMNRQIDAYIAWEPFPTMAVVKGFGRRLLTSKDIWPNHPCCVLVVSDELIKESPDVVKKIVRAHVRATEYIQEHPADSVNIAIKYTHMEKSVVESALRHILFDYRPSISGEKEYVRFLNSWNYLRRKIDPDSFVSNFIDTKFLE